jgi:predicted amidohydrolase
VNGIQVGLAICYDIRFPELARKLILERDISLLLHPGGWPRDEGLHTWHMFVQVRAMENSIYLFALEIIMGVLIVDRFRHSVKNEEFIFI